MFQADLEREKKWNVVIDFLKGRIKIVNDNQFLEIFPRDKKIWND